MEPATQQNQNTPAGYTPPSARKSGKLKPITLAILALLVVSGIATGSYVLGTTNAKESNNQNALADTNSAVADKEKKKNSYTTKDGLTIELPEEYQIIVGVDGNRGGAPGSELKIGKVNKDGVVEDSVYDWLKIESSNTAGGDGALNDTVELLKNQTEAENSLSGEKITVTISDTTISGKPAKKLVTSAGRDSYEGIKQYFVVVSGDFTYIITDTVSSTNDKDERLETVLNNLKFDPVTL